MFFVCVQLCGDCGSESAYNCNIIFAVAEKIHCKSILD